MSAQIIQHNGKPVFVVLPISEYEDLLDRLEDGEDMAAIVAWRKNPGELIPTDVVERLLGDESKVKIWREHRGLTQSALAKAVGVSQGAVSQIESAGGGSLEMYKKIAAALSVDLEDIA